MNGGSRGYYPISDLQSRVHERIDREVASFKKIPFETMRIVSEGGDRILNGQGTLIVVEACEFQRNPNMTREELEVQYRQALGVNNVIWLKQGTVEDDPYTRGVLPGPNGIGVAYRSASANNHADEFCRFINANTILLAHVSKKEALGDPVAAENHRHMKLNYNILKNAQDSNGNSFKIVRIPMPAPLYFDASPGDEVYASLLSSYSSKNGSRLSWGKTRGLVRNFGIPMGPSLFFF